MIDGGVFYGLDAPSGRRLDLEQIARMLGRLGANRALAMSSRAVHFDAAEGNAELLEAARRSDGLLAPIAVLAPYAHQPAQTRIAALMSAGFHGVALCPGPAGLDLSGYGLGAIGREAAGAGAPVQAFVRTPSDLSAAVERIAGAGARLLVRWSRGGQYNFISDMLAIAQDHERVFFDTSTVTQTGGLELLVEAMGAHRLFLASNAPHAYEGCPYALLSGSALGEADRRMIAGGSLARIYGLAPPERMSAPSGWEALRARPKIDTHWHTSGWNIVEPRISDMDHLQTFDAMNYRAVVTHSIRALSDDLTAGNAETLALIERDDRVFGSVVVNPLDVAGSIREIDKYRDHPRFVAFKSIQDFYGLELDAPGYVEIVEHARSVGDWPFMAHGPGMRAMAERFPDVDFIFAHATWRIDELGRLPNVWHDVATSTRRRDETDISRLIDVAGADRVLFASDGPLMDPAWTLAKLWSLDPPEAALEQILNRNAERAFPRLAGARGSA